MNTELIIIIVSAILIVVGVLLWQKGNKLLSTGKKAKAVIFTNNFKGTGTINSGVYYPVVRFTTEKEEWITQELSIGYFPAKQEGTKLEVIYDPENPTNVEINSTFQLEILPRLLFAIGLIGFIFGVLEYLNIVNLITN